MIRKIALITCLLILAVINVDAQKYTLEECCQFIDNGDYDEALPSLLDLFNQEEKKEWDEDRFALTYILIYRVYSSGGFYKEIQNLNKDAFKIFNLKSPVANTELSRTLWRMSAALELELRNYDDAIRQAEQAQWMYEDESIYDNGYFGVLTLLGASYFHKKEFAMAKLYFDEAYDTHIEYLGDITTSRNSDSFQLLNFLGLYAQQFESHEKAEQYFLAIINSIEGDPILEDVKNMAKSNLANLYTLLGRYDEADELYKTLSYANPSFSYTLFQNRAFSELIKNDYSSATTYLDKSNYEGFRLIESIIFNFSEVERENLWFDLSEQLTMNNNFFAFWTKKEDTIKKAFEYNDFARTFNLNFRQLIKDLFLSSDNASNSARKLEWDKYQNNRGLLSYGFKTVSEHDSIARQVIEQERMLLSKVNLDLSKYFKDNYDVSALSKELADDEIILDCISMSYMKGKSFEDGFDQGFSVYALTNESDVPLLIPVCKQLDLYSYVRNENWDAEKINELYTEHNDTLFQLVVKPLIPHLKDKKTIYFRPTSLLSLINIGAIRMPNGKRFDEEFNFKIVSSFSSLKDGYKPGPTNSLALFGDAQYDEINDFYENSDNLAVAPTHEYAILTRGDRGKWGALPGTRIEIQHIDSIACINAIPSTTYVGSTSSESSFKSLSCHSPSIIHIATHGYFIADNETARNNNFLQKTTGYSWGNHLMLYSGLLFSGANAVWNGNSFPNPVDDGIVTADEISRLDLSNTNLVVLSACDSGRGHYNGTDGIMGLQRAFKLAGAKTMVMSLWKVPDIPTSMLMGYFYQNLFQGMDIRSSLIEAQKQLQNEGYTDPFYWASFIVID